MINHVLLICSTIIIYEILFNYNFLKLIKTNLNIFKKIIKLKNLKNISDIKKERALIIYSKSMFFSSSKILIIIMSIIILLLMLNLISNSYLKFLMSFSGVLGFSLIAILYHKIRKKKNNYNKAQEYLHDFTLNNKIINKSLFEIEKIFFLKENNIEKNAHIFISGLPRSGTTILLNFLFSSKEYGSLSYKNMPFILSPNINDLFFNKTIERKERMHTDNIFIDKNSPEALDEIFFKYDEKFIKNELINYINLILSKENKNKYISKNNLNYKRVELIKSILNNCNFLIPIREPLQHSLSLLNQHRNFINLQKRDDFIRRYMNYLGHNEFGLNHKFWNEPINYRNPNELNYWLEQWYLFYEFIYKKYKFHKYCNFIIYEKLYNENYLKNLLIKLEIEKLDTIDLNYFKITRREITENFSLNLYKKSVELYKKFN